MGQRPRLPEVRHHPPKREAQREIDADRRLLVLRLSQAVCGQSWTRFRVIAYPVASVVASDLPDCIQQEGNFHQPTPSHLGHYHQGRMVPLPSHS